MPPHARHASVRAAEQTLRSLPRRACATRPRAALGWRSALWAAPAPGLDIASKTALTRGLLKCGADIHEMNTGGRHLLTRIK